MERCKRHEKAQFEKAYSEKAQIKIKWKSPPKHRTKSIRNHGGGPGPEQSPPPEGGWQTPKWGVRPHQGAAAPLVAPLATAFRRNVRGGFLRTVPPTINAVGKWKPPLEVGFRPFNVGIALFAYSPLFLGYKRDGERPP